jgi:DNA (cytosine-5)-methyltransferase 1
MRYFSTFSGIGGFELGIEKAYGIRNADGSQIERSQTDQTGDKEQGLQPAQGENPSATQGQTGERPAVLPDERPLCVGFCEIDRYATEVYKKHFNHQEYGDITKIETGSLPDFDLLVGGFPCQAFSIAGKRRGFDDTRGTLFFDVARILKDRKPKHVLLENVKGLLSHDGGRTFKTIVTTLAQLGYAVEWQVLNAKNFGVPQNRERVYIVGHLGDFGGRQIFPFRDSNCSHLREITQGVSDAQRVYDPAGIAKSQKALGGGQGARTGLYAFCDMSTQEFKLTDNARTLQARYNKGYSHRKAEVSGVFDGAKIRRLTPKECERLMGLPDLWTAEGINGPMSDTQRYKMCGNGVVTNVVEAIIKRLCLKNGM